MTKYTLGPWGIHLEPFLTSITSGNELVADVYMTLPEGKNNAQLIAAAPDMAEACTNALGVLEEPGMMDVDEWKTWQKKTINDLREALAKAGVQ